MWRFDEVAHHSVSMSRTFHLLACRKRRRRPTDQTHPGRRRPPGPLPSRHKSERSCTDQFASPHVTLTKLDPAQTANRTWTCSNPTSLEIVPAFLQDGDNPADWAMYVHAQRRLHAHTTIATTWPAIVHLAELMEEYIV
ncbi:RNaseH domain-containing protein [Streptomyces longwoodensis]|uniref:RNaseH domain-containing protein n=1 Tax=Streptomyces longwoodensis TaxID=68231 RepID=UPI0036F6EF78